MLVASSIKKRQRVRLEMQRPVFEIEIKCVRVHANENEKLNGFTLEESTL